MNVLLLGGTGAMGFHLARCLEEKNVHCYVTTRGQRKSTDRIIYLQGNAKDDQQFLKQTINSHNWDCIVDFMAFESLDDYEMRVNMLLQHTKQFIMISSCRVYADAHGKVTESTPRLIDSDIEQEYKNSNEYAIVKCKEENILFNNPLKNWTIVRPYITFGEDRFQLGVFEKERWLYRALHGRSIFISEDILYNRTTLTYGKWVAQRIASLIGVDNTYGQVYNIVSSKSYTWKEILDTYCDVISDVMGKRPRVYIENKSEFLEYGNSWALKYDRYLDREFDNSKIMELTNETIESPIDDLAQCLRLFLKRNQRWAYVDWKQEFKRDKKTGEHTSILEATTIKAKIKYVLIRLGIM